MPRFPKPRGFWDYALFALALTVALFSVFWMNARFEISWTDAALAFGESVLCVFVIILARRSEKAHWIAHPTWLIYPLASLGACGLLFAAIYSDAYFLHRSSITSGWLSKITFIVILLFVSNSISSLRQHRSYRQKPGKIT